MSEPIESRPLTEGEIFWLQFELAMRELFNRPYVAPDREVTP